jgi:hypothetical protein
MIGYLAESVKKLPREKKMQEKNTRGLVVQLNFRPTEFHSSGTQVRRWSSGPPENLESGEYYMFNTHGQLLDKMSKWHVEKYRADKRFRIADEVVSAKPKTR